MPKRLAYVDVTAEMMAQLLDLPEGSEVVGVGWEPGVLLVQVRSDAVPARTEDKRSVLDPESDDRAEHVVIKAGPGGGFGSFEKVDE